MKVSFDKLPIQIFAGLSYQAKAVDQTGKWEFVAMIKSNKDLPKFIAEAEFALKETCLEVVFHNSWTKTKFEIFNQEKIE